MLSGLVMMIVQRSAAASFAPNTLVEQPSYQLVVVRRSVVYIAIAIARTVRSVNSDELYDLEALKRYHLATLSRASDFAS
jgi:hypothetical protein